MTRELIATKDIRAGSRVTVVQVLHRLSSAALERARAREKGATS